MPFIGIHNTFSSYQHLKASSSKGNNSEGRKSLFTQQFAASGGVTFGVPEKKINNLQLSTETSKAVQMASKTTAQFPRSSVISGEGLLGCEGGKMLSNRAVEEIHSENLAKLESMTQDEILEEQARIKSSLGKQMIVEFNKSTTLCFRANIHQPR